MNKIYAVILFLAACGSPGSNDFLDDFGSNTLTFDRCDYQGASLTMDSSIEYIDGDHYLFKFQSQDIHVNLDRELPNGSPIGDVFYIDRYIVPVLTIVKGHDGKAFFTYGSHTCYQ